MTSDPTNLNGTAKAVIVVAIILFCYAMVAWIVLTGASSEAAKTSLWWFFVTPLALLAGIGFTGVLSIVQLKLNIGEQK
jgi:hypothetical protein